MMASEGVERRFGLFGHYGEYSEFEWGAFVHGRWKPNGLEVRV